MTTNDAPGAGRREWVGLAVLALPTLLLALDLSVLYLALPHLAADLGAGSTQQLWIIDIYGFMIAGFLVTMGTLGDRIGRRRLLLIGAAAFGVASVLAAYAASPEMLIATRALLGVAGATLMPSTLALISNMFRDPRQRGLAIAVSTSCFMGGAAVGPVVGGVLLESFWWGSVFLLGVPVMVLLLVAGPLVLPEYREPHAGRLDLTSVALSLAAILPVIYGLKELAREVGRMPVLAVVVGAVVGAVFVRRQRRLPDPLLDVRLFGDRVFSAALVILTLGVATQGGIMFLVAQDLQLVIGLSPLRAGLWLAPGSLAMVAGSLLAPAMAQRASRAHIIAVGMTIAAAGYLLLTQVDGASGLAGLVVGVVVVFLGIGLMAPLAVDLVVGSASPEKAGSAASMSQTSGDFGIALGVAAMGSVGTSVYRDHVVLPAEVHAESAGVARDSIAGAVSVAGQGSGPFGAGLLDSAHEAFTAGMHAAAGLSAIVVVGLAILAVTAIRRRPASAVAHLDQCDQADPTQRPRAEPTRTRPVGKDLTGTTSEEAAMPGA